MSSNKKTLQDISPHWTAILKKGVMNEYDIAKISSPSQCLVGEAHGGNIGYMHYRWADTGTPSCPDCTNYAATLATIAKYPEGVEHTRENRRDHFTIDDRFKAEVVEFVRHWNEKHSQR